MVTLIASMLQHSQINCLKSVFLQAKATHFETIITVNEVKSDKTRSFNVKVGAKTSEHEGNTDNMCNLK